MGLDAAPRRDEARTLRLGPRPSTSVGAFSLHEWIGREFAFDTGDERSPGSPFSDRTRESVVAWKRKTDIHEENG